jgi:hypothetical protein
MNNLNLSFDIENSNVNNFNCALDNNTSMFLTKKINNFESELIGYEYFLLLF